MVEAPAAPNVAASGDRRLHLSIDDLPYMLHEGTPVPRSVDEILAINQAFIDVLAKHEVPASVFFNCQRLQHGDRTPLMWATAGHVVGNHTDTHIRTPSDDLSEWKVNVGRCHDQLVAATGAPITAFRFPYLHAGRNEAVRDEALAFIAALGERRAPVTVATSEWMHGFAWRRTDDPAEKQFIVDDLARHLDVTVRYADELARQTHGGPVSQIVLLHLNEASLAVLDQMLASWAADGWSFVGLHETLDDPIYALPEAVFPSGPSWLYRVNRSEVAKVQSFVFGDEERAVVERFGPWPGLGE